MVNRARGLLAGVAAAALVAIAASPSLVAQSGPRTISLHNIHTKETITVQYKTGGKYVDAAMAQVDRILRDHRKDETTKMDPALVDLLWEMHAELGSKEPIHIISGYRSRATNDMLRRTVGGQASESRHIQGKAADVHFPDVPIRNLRYSAMVRERGGVGYYPTSALPFVHVDTDAVRSWPRLPRLELALLFPSGQSKHTPADGGPLTRDDVRMAQSKYPQLAAQIADFRNPNAARQQVAMATPAAADVPRLMQAPQTAQRPRPASMDRDGLTAILETPMLVQGPRPAQRPQPTMASLTGGPIGSPLAIAPKTAPAPAQKLAAINPTALPGGAVSDGRFAWGGTGFVAAPAFDDEHPEELTYRPFPIAPFLTNSASEPLMSELIAHDVARTVEFIDQAASIVPLRLRVGEQQVRQMWAQQFTGAAIGIDKLREAQAPMPQGLQKRAVRTSEKR